MGTNTQARTHTRTLTHNNTCIGLRLYANTCSRIYALYKYIIYIYIGLLYSNDILYIGLYKNRGVQYVHCVMHKCIMVKVWGKRNHRKYVQNTEILRNQGEIWQSRGMKDFVEAGGNGVKERK